MKYPQLVSTRAVSAISDWLVTQLEQLGVDASSVYSRLLLSLLHTPLQINALDLAEISDNKAGNFLRNKSIISKGGNGTNYRRFSSADTETLKRLAAIDSLLEAVPSDQQLSKIETLVDELSLKLREIEEQNGLDDSVFEIGSSEDNALCNSKVDPTEKKPEAIEDPAKRYFNAFPALSDQSKNEYSHKKAAWPQVNANKSSHSQVQSEDPSSSVSVSGGGAGGGSGATVATKKKPKRRRVVNSTMTSALSDQMDTRTANAAPQTKSGAISTVKNSTRNGAASKVNQKKKTSEMWDTDFDGAWEMGRDLIREFVMKQNNRNRSISENDSVRCISFENDATMKVNSGIGNADVACQAKSSTVLKRCDDVDNDEENLMRVAVAATSALFDKTDVNIYTLNLPDSETVSTSSRITDSSSMLMSNNEKAVIRSEGYSTPDTLASWNELDAASAVAPRHREHDHESMMNYIEFTKGGGGGIDTGSDCVDSGCDDNNCLAAFEAKFDRNVEALWNDTKSDELNATANKSESQMNHSFWFDYHNNGLDKQTNQINTNDRFKQFLQANQANCYSSLNANDRSAFATAQPNSLNSNSSSTIGGMNLTSSIWTDNPNNSEDDVSFYTNARQWEMNHQSKSQGHKFNYYSNEPTTTTTTLTNLQSSTNNTGVGASNFDIGNYENSNFSKWSDTETPFGSSQSDAMSPQKKQNEKIRKNLFGNSYFYNYQSSQPMSNTTSGQTMALPDNTEYSFSQAQKVIKRKVTLVNHSSSSCFKEVEPLSIEAKQELMCMNSTRKYHAVPIDALEQEDLLTSERSRFRPIKQTYADGYTFDISNKLDEISYERSQSGMLYHDSEVYREYYVYDEEGNGGSRCDTEANAAAEFTLKYCIRQNDKCCQTDDLTLNQNVVSPNNSFLLKADLNRMQSFSSLSSANTSSSSRNNLLYYQNNDLNGSQCDENSMNNDCFDRMNEISQDGWLLTENRRCTNNNNNAHALWEHCATCSNDVISMPANSLLKDELSADGDEIMSDLKYLIQSISFHSDWEDGDSDSVVECDDDDDDDETMANSKVGDLLTDINQLGDCVHFDDENLDDFANDHIYSNVNKLISDLLQPEKAQTLVQAISEKCRLLTDEKSTVTGHDTILKIIHDTKDVQATKNEITCNSLPFANSADANANANADADANSNGHFGSLWAYNDNSIWRKELPAEIDVKHSTELKSANRLNEQWEHANLEKIWKTMATSTEQPLLLPQAPQSSPKPTPPSPPASPSSSPPPSSSSHPATNSSADVFMAIDKQPQLKLDKTIFSTSLNDDDGMSTTNQTSLTFPEHSKSEQNTLEKFMNLIKQSNVEGQCSAAATAAAIVGGGGRGVSGALHSQQHTEQCRKNTTRYDRKRRHSATSQNCFDQLNYALSNCDAIESFKKLATKTVDDYDGLNVFGCDATDKPTTTTIITCKYWTACDSFCLTSTLAFNNNNNIVGDTENIFNCYHKQMQHQQQQQQQQSNYDPDKIMDTLNANDTLATMHPTTFLKQVAAMVSRPLTR